jgi:hypothetical protein
MVFKILLLRWTETPNIAGLTDLVSKVTISLLDNLSLRTTQKRISNFQNSKIKKYWQSEKIKLILNLASKISSLEIE